jgi:cytochrome c oxidase subunit 2
MLVADEAYIRESILDPGAKITLGYENIMPTFKGLVTEEGVLDLIAYVRSLTPAAKAEPRGARP